MRFTGVKLMCPRLTFISDYRAAGSNPTLRRSACADPNAEQPQKNKYNLRAGFEWYFSFAPKCTRFLTTVYNDAFQNTVHRTSGMVTLGYGDPCDVLCVVKLLTWILLLTVSAAVTAERLLEITSNCTY